MAKIFGNNTDEELIGTASKDKIFGKGGNDSLFGDEGRDFLKGGDGLDELFGGMGHDALYGGNGDDILQGDDGNDRLFGGKGNDELWGGDGRDVLRGGNGDDTLEGGAGNDMLVGGKGSDTLYAFSWGGEPVPDQSSPEDQYNDGEPVSDKDILVGGKDEDTFVFRWLIDATKDILDKHRDPETGDIDYSGNGVAGENGATHDHWVESIGKKIVRDYNPDEDTLVFEGHTLALDKIRIKNGDSYLNFVSDQGANGGAHDGDKLGVVVVKNVVLTEDDIEVDAGVFYGVEDPWSAGG